MIGASNPNEIRGKVDPHYKSYVWVLEVWSFDKLREVGVFSYLLYSLVKSHLNGWDILRLGWPCFQSQRLGLSEEIPRVVLDSPETDRGLCVLLVC